MAGDARWLMWATERWIAAGADRSGVAQEHYIWLDWHWACALTGDDPAGKAAEVHARGEPADVVRAAAEAARARSDERGAYLFARRAERFLAEL
ncbi:hypothetical protein ACFYOK_13265 [Microbispora bryophytorum]|uniref:hypothetical protein n=1 Tax=Microbispora bryophytorum TaxID=1460882 RepID=UPI0033FBE7A6